MKFKFSLFVFICFIGQLSVNAQTLKYTNGNNAWNPDSLGNHRAIIQFAGTGGIAHVKIDWRRRDEHPELKRIIVQDVDGKSLPLVGYDNVNRESGEIYFEAKAGKYFVYFMPYKNEGRSNYPKGVYLKPIQA
jgi:hypothetical protein